MNKRKLSNRNMLQGPLLPSIISYTVPIILTSLLQLLFNAADLVIVGRFRGSLSVAAVSATGSLAGLIVNLFIGLSVGVGVAVAHALGGHRDSEVQSTVHTALPTAIVGGTIVTVLGICLAEPMLRLMGTPDNVLPLSSIYLKIYFSGMVFVMVYNFCASILRAAGDTKSPLLYLSLSGVLNVILNIVFVTAFDMNVEGVALATTISQILSAVLVVIALMRRTDACRLELKKMRFHRVPLLKLLRIGLPAGIQSSLFSISNVIIQSSINSFGDVFMSGNGAAASIEGFVYVCFNSFQQTVVNFVGQNTGAGQLDRAKKTLHISLVCSAALALFLGILSNVFGEQLLSIYVTDSPQAIQYGMLRLRYVSLLYFLCALMDVTTGGLRGLGASLEPMLVSILGVCGFRLLWVFTIFQIPALHTPDCLFLSYPISWLITFILHYVSFKSVYKKTVAAQLPFIAKGACS